MWRLAQVDAHFGHRLHAVQRGSGDTLFRTTICGSTRASGASRGCDGGRASPADRCRAVPRRGRASGARALPGRARAGRCCVPGRRGSRPRTRRASARAAMFARAAPCAPLRRRTAGRRDPGWQWCPRDLHPRSDPAIAAARFPRSVRTGTPAYAIDGSPASSASHAASSHPSSTRTSSSVIAMDGRRRRRDACVECARSSLGALRRGIEGERGSRGPAARRRPACRRSSCCRRPSTSHRRPGVTRIRRIAASVSPRSAARL